MTTKNAATVSRDSRAGVFASFMTLLALGVAGCATSGTPPIIGSLTQTPASETTPVPLKGKLTIAPIRAPDGEAAVKQMQAQLEISLQKQGIGVAKSPAEKSDYTLRGYILATAEKNGTKISYFWDVTDAANKRVNRIKGEELAPTASNAKDPWSALTPQVIQTITDRTAASLAAWLPTQSPAPATTPTTPTSQTPVETSSTSVGVEPQRSTQAMVVDITGAPGDGSTKLRDALKRELANAGLKVAEQASPQTYRVEGSVIMTPGKDGKESIKIFWKVKDPNGKQLGVVSQKNDVPQGSLNGAWGRDADDAAGAAVHGILALFPKQTAVN